MRHRILAAVLGAAAVAGCGGSDDPPPAAGAPTATIAIKEFKFVPETATVKAGVKISVPNEDRAPHTLTDAAEPREFDSGTVEKMQTGSITFKKAGTFKVFCELHPYMKGTVIVQ